MSGSAVWADVGIGMSVVVALRLLLMVGPARAHVPAWGHRFGAHIAPAVTAALLVPLLSADAGPDLVAYALVTPVALRTRSVAWTLAAGLPMIWVARALG